MLYVILVLVVLIVLALFLVAQPRATVMAGLGAVGLFCGYWLGTFAAALADSPAYGPSLFWLCLVAGALGLPTLFHCATRREPKAM